MIRQEKKVDYELDMFGSNITKKVTTHTIKNVGAVSFWCKANMKIFTWIRDGVHVFYYCARPSINKKIN